MIFQVLTFIQYFSNLVCWLNKDCRIEISSYFEFIPNRKFYLGHWSAWPPKSTTLPPCNLQSFLKKPVIFFPLIFFLQHLLCTLETTKKIWNGVFSLSKDITLPSLRFFLTYLQDFSENSGSQQIMNRKPLFFFINLCPN